MKALDTFRKLPMRHNCAQAVANNWKMLYDDKNIVESYGPYVGGRAPGGYCGALYAAMEACKAHSAEVEAEFKEICGDTLCREIKRKNHTPCEVCVDTADRLVAKYRD